MVAQQQPYDHTTPHLEHTADKTGRRGADWRLALTRAAPDEPKFASTNVEWLTRDELVALRDEIDHKLGQADVGKRIDTHAELIELAHELRVRPDWHEPDEHDVTATVRGTSFDNAGFWGRNSDGSLSTFGGDQQEIWVELFQDGRPVAQVNLATLFAFATGYEG